MSTWVLVAGASGTITTEWHGDSWFGSQGALDIGANGGDSVAMYMRIDQTTSYGYFVCDLIQDSCEAFANPGHKAIKCSIGRSNDLNLFGDCGYIHVVPWNLSPGTSGVANRQIANIGSGVNPVSGCFTAPHLHQTANGTHLFESPVPSPASGGNNAYWYWYS